MHTVTCHNVFTCSYLRRNVHTHLGQVTRDTGIAPFTPCAALVGGSKDERPTARMRRKAASMEGRLPAAPGRAICFFAILLAALVGVSGAHDGLLSNTKQQPLSSACASLKASGINVHATKKATVGGGNIPDTGGGAACHVEFALHVKPAIAFTGAWPHTHFVMETHKLLSLLGPNTTSDSHILTVLQFNRRVPDECPTTCDDSPPSFPSADVGSGP